MNLEFPLYVIRIGGGFASVVDPHARGSERQQLIVVGSEGAARELIDQFQIAGQPAALHNAREFSWLLKALREPVTWVAFDPNPTSDAINARWSVSVQALLEDHLEVDFSPWNYPVFVIAQQDGFVSIQGTASDGRPLKAIVVFTSSDRAEDYLNTTGEGGELCPLSTMKEARRFLERLQLDVFAVALDPQLDDERLSAKHCFDIATLLEKYLRFA